MLNEIDCTNVVDGDGNPAGGDVVGAGLHILWQNGPRRKDVSQVEMGPANGAFVEDVIEAAIQRLQFFQASRYACRENALAITKLDEAQHWLNHRRLARAARGVEGLNIV